MKTRSSVAGPSVRNRLAALLLLFVLPLLGIASSAKAQGTSGTLPDPISSSELSRYAEVLDLSQEQRQAIEGAHNKYRADFARLRDGEIEEYLKTHGGAGNISITFDRSKVEKDTRELQKLLGRVRSLDERFFDQLLALLTERQQTILPRIRQARERVRYQSGMSLIGIMVNPASHVDLSALMIQLDIAPAFGSDLDLALQQYESRLTAAARDLHDVSVNKELLMFDRMAEQGYGAEVLEDPSRAEGLIDALFAAMNHVQDEMNDQAAEIADLNRRTLKELELLMPADQARKLRTRFGQMAYHDPLVSGRQVSRRFEAALERKDLTDQQRAQVESMQVAYAQERRQHVDRLMDAHDENSRSGIMINPTEEQEALRQKREKAVEDEQERCRGFDERTMLALDAVLGEDIAQRIARRIEQEDAASGEDQVETRGVMISVMTVGGEGTEAGISSFSTSFTADEINLGGPLAERGGVPGPLSQEDMARHARHLELTDDEQAIVSALHEDYCQQFDEATHDRLEELGELNGRIGFGAFHIQEDDEEPEMPTVSDVDRMFGLKRSLMGSIDEMDNLFFEDVRMVINDDDRASRVDRARMARQRDVLVKAGGGGGGLFSFGGGGGGGAFVSLPGMGGEAQEESVDLTAVVDGLDLPHKVCAEIDPILIEYEQQVTDVFRTRYEASQRADEQMQKNSVRAMQMTEDGRRVEYSADAEGFELMEAKRQEANKAADRIVQLNRACLKRLLGSLDSSSAASLQSAYDRAAFPAVFRDSDSMDRQLQAAMSLPDLTPARRRDVQDLWTQYQVDYDACCQKLVEFHRGPDDGGESESLEGHQAIQGLQQRMRELEKLKFERTELNGRTKTSLRALLTEEQAQRVGLTDDESQTP